MEIKQINLARIIRQNQVVENYRSNSSFRKTPPFRSEILEQLQENSY